MPIAMHQLVTASTYVGVCWSELGASRHVTSCRTSKSSDLLESRVRDQRSRDPSDRAPASRATNTRPAC